MISENGGSDEKVRHIGPSASWKGKLARNVTNSTRQEDAHYAQSGTNYIDRHQNGYYV